MSDPEKVDVFNAASEALQRFSEDIADLRDPEVRHIVEQIPFPPPSSNTPPLPPDKPAELKARLIATQTALYEAGEALTLAKSNATELRKRAARAEGKVVELGAQLKEKESQQGDVIRRASERIATLEQENVAASKTAAESSLLLTEVVERGRSGTTVITSERDAAMLELRAAKQTIESLKRDLAAATEELRQEKKNHEFERNGLEGQITSLEQEVQYSRKNVDKMADISSKDMKEQGQIVESIQNENVQLRTELAGQSEQITSIRRELRDVRNSYIELQEQYQKVKASERDLVSYRSEVERLRKEGNQSQAAVHHLAALTAEKEELSRLICALSPTGDPQEGLSILRNSAHQQGDTDSSAVSQVRSLMQKHQQELLEIERAMQEHVSNLQQQIRSTSARLSHVEAERDAIAAERDEAKSSAKRNQRMRKVLQREKNHLHAALEEIETDFEKSNEMSDPSERMQERCKAAERTADEYKTAAEEFEKSLVECQKELREIKSKLAASSIQDSDMATDFPSTDALKSQLRDALKAASEAVRSRIEAETLAKHAKLRLCELQEEMKQLKLHDEVMVLSSGDLDYDPSKTKVFHFIQNPLRKAMIEDKLRRESAASKKRSRSEMDCSMSPAGDVSGGGDNTELQKEIEVLTRRNSELEKASKVGMRTGEIAKKKIEEVRAAVYNLFGWSMRVTGAKYTISSIYAADQNDFLEFGINEKGTMSLIETEYASRLTDELEEFVHKRNSFPALLANITIENFDQTTAVL